jgi:hypothetical protein
LVACLDPRVDEQVVQDQMQTSPNPDVEPEPEPELEPVTEGADDEPPPSDFTRARP